MKPDRSVEGRLEELGIELPPAPRPVAAYVTVVRTGSLLFTSGAGPVADGEPVYRGKMGDRLNLQQGREAARLTMLNLLSVVREELGTLDRVRRIVKVLGFVASTPDFHQQPQVLNGASELLLEVFGADGRHARSAIGVNVLPFDIPVEIEMIVEVA